MLKKWFIYGIVIMLANFAFLLLIANLLAIDIAFENIGGFLLLSALIACVISFGGYLKYHVYFYLMLFFNFLAMAVCLYIINRRLLETWDDIIMMIYFLLIIFLGLIISVIMQGVYLKVLKKHH